MTSVKLDWQTLCLVSRGRFFLCPLKRTHDRYLPWWGLQHHFLRPSGLCAMFSEIGFPMSGAHQCCSWGSLQWHPRFLAPLLPISVSFAFPCPSFSKELLKARGLEFSATSSCWWGQVASLLQASVSFSVNWTLKIVLPTRVRLFPECFIFVFTTVVVYYIVLLVIYYFSIT